IFTAPLDGRYFFSAILTGHKNEKIEAVLSKSNYGMARVDSAGYQPEGLENKPMAEAKPTPGSLAVFNIILPLQVGDTVCIDLVMGKLAHSVEPLTIFSGVLLYEDVTNQKTSKTMGLERDTLNDVYPPGLATHMLCVDSPSVLFPNLRMFLDLL
ncbi:hypothetical protein M9458_034414, partial [Cirrhinus mrigala]